jgi:hypothetical protein
MKEVSSDATILDSYITNIVQVLDLPHSSKFEMSLSVSIFLLLS